MADAPEKLTKSETLERIATNPIIRDIITRIGRLCQGGNPGDVDVTMTLEGHVVHADIVGIEGSAKFSFNILGRKEKTDG
jgi:hypothetical protein